MKVSSEILNHLICDNCRMWWSMPSFKLSIGDNIFCPRCGKLNIVSEIDDMHNLKDENTPEKQN